MDNGPSTVDGRLQRHYVLRYAQKSWPNRPRLVSSESLYSKHKSSLMQDISLTIGILKGLKASMNSRYISDFKRMGSQVTLCAVMATTS